MDEIRLERPAFLALLDAVHARAIVGIAQDKLFPQDEEERRASLKQGIAQLEQRGLLQADHQPDPDLLRLARIVAYPQIALLIIRHVAELGPQLFLLYHSPEGTVEQTFPAEGIHRLAVISGIPLLLARATQLLSLSEQFTLRSSVEIAQEDFFRCDHLARHEQHWSACEILQRAGMSSSSADILVDALQSSDFRGEVALLKCVNETIVDARDVVVIRGKQTSWYATQIIAGEPLLLVETVNALMMQSLLSHYFVELTEVKV